MTAVFEDATAWGASIRDAREEARLSQKVLAAELGTTRQRLSRIEDGEEGTTSRKPNERRAISIAVAEFTGHRDRLGLSAPEPSEVEQLRQEFEENLQREILRLTKERVEALTSIEDRLLRLEAGELGAGSPGS